MTYVEVEGKPLAILLNSLSSLLMSGIEPHRPWETGRRESDEDGVDEARHGDGDIQMATIMANGVGLRNTPRHGCESRGRQFL